MKFLKQWRFCATTADDIKPLTHCSKNGQTHYKKIFEIFSRIIEKKNEYEKDLWVS